MKNKRRKAALGFLILCLGILVFDAKVWSAESGGDFTYTVSNETAVITGYNGKELDLSIPSVIDGYKVTGIGKYAFYDGSLTSVQFPSTLTTIGDHAFYCCPLTTVKLPQNLTSIGNYAFADCYLLKSAVISDKVTKIGDYAFSGCPLKSVKLPSGLKIIGNGVFADTSLTTVQIPKGVTKIGNNAFSSGLLTSISIPEGVTAIGDRAFYRCYKLKSVKLPGSLKKIGRSAFAYCSSLISIQVPEGVTSIGNNVFQYSGIHTIYGVYGSYAEKFAKKNSIRFVSVKTVKNTVTAKNIVKTYSAKKQTFLIGASCKSKGKMTYKSDNAAISVNANGKVSVRAKYVGKANITIRSQSGGGYEAASKKIVIKINPSKTSLSCVSNIKGLKVKAVWKKNISGSGYQLQYSTSKTFAGSNKSVLVSGSKTQSKIIGNLKKGKTYYIRMRTYKVVNGTKFYASWSGAKKVMIRK